MGLGEISIAYILWHLERAKENSIALIEEPETFLAPRSQAALVDVLASYCASKGLWIVLTTHSPAILQRVPSQHIRYIARPTETGKVIVPSHPSQYLEPLGVLPERLGVLLVEDRAAREFARAWLGATEMDLLQCVSIHDVGGDGEVIKSLAFPKLNGLGCIVGVLDGDRRAMTAKENGAIAAKVNWPFMFLPGDKTPEVLLRECSEGQEAALATRLNRPIATVEIVLASLQGIDHHDWLEEAHKRLGVSYESLVVSLYSLWAEAPVNAAAASEAGGQLRMFLTADRSPPE